MQGYVRMKSHLQGFESAEHFGHVCGIDGQLAVIDHFVAGRMQGHRLRHNTLHLIRHHAQLPAKTGQVAQFGAVIEQVEADALG